MRLSRRNLIAAVSAAAAQACCTAIPDQKCWTAASTACKPPDPLEVGLPAARCEIFSFDEVHRATPTVYIPTCDADLVELFTKVPDGRHVTVRGGGQALYTQSLNDDLLFSLEHIHFRGVGDPVQDETGYHITTGAGAVWSDVITTVARVGLMPPSLVTAPSATVGGTLSSDCLSRMSPIVGKEGNQIRKLTIVTPGAGVIECSRQDPDPDKAKLFNAVIGGFGYLGVVTKVTFDLVPVRSRPMVPWGNPCVFTRSTRHGPSVNWDALLQQLRNQSVKLRKLYLGNPQRYRGTEKTAGVPDALSSTPEWSALSIASFLTGAGMAANLLQQRYVDPQPLRPFPSGVYQANATFPPAAELESATGPTLVELGLDMFPEGEFVDELFGWAFFLGNSTTPAKASAHLQGNRLNFTQQSFALPAGSPDAVDTRPIRRFIELVEARLHGADLRPEDVDFLYIPADDFLMSASHGLTSFVITVSFAELNRKAFSRRLVDMLRALSNDCRTLGGRVHLVKGVYADRDDLRAMYGDAAGEFLKLKRRYDPKFILRNEFFDGIFLA